MVCKGDVMVCKGYVMGVIVMGKCVTECVKGQCVKGIGWCVKVMDGV